MGYLKKQAALHEGGLPVYQSVNTLLLWYKNIYCFVKAVGFHMAQV